MADRGAYEYVQSGTAPDVPVLTTPSNHATGVSTSVNFAWAASTPSAADTYGFSLSNTSSFSPLITSTSTALTTTSVSGLDRETVYYWRVEGTNAYGTSSWSANSDFTTIVNIPGTVTMTTPANGATNVALSPTLGWSTLASASTYNVQLSTSSAFATSIVDTTGLTATTLSVSGLSRTTSYYWRVAGVNDGGTGPWASSFSFSTIPEAPIAPTPVTPSGDDVEKTPTFSWGSVPNTSTYSMQVSTDGSFGSSLEVKDIYETFCATTLDYSKQYYWRVKAYGPGGVSDWSSSISFTTIAEPVKPEPSSTDKTPNYGLEKLSNIELVYADANKNVKNTLNDSFDEIDSAIGEYGVIEVSANYNIKPTDEVIIVTANSPTLMLPAGASISVGKRYIIANNGAGTPIIDSVNLNVNDGATVSITGSYVKKLVVRDVASYFVY